MKGYQSHESFWADILMYKNLVVRALICSLVVQIIFIFFISQGLLNDLKKVSIYGTTYRMPLSVAQKYYFGYDIFGKGMEVEPQLRGYVKNYPRLPLKAYRDFADWLTHHAYQKLKLRFKFWFKISFLAYLLSVAYIAVFVRTSKNVEKEKFVRGAILLSIEELNERLAKEAKKNPLSCLTIGDTVIPYEMESKHILILGTSGSGKGVLLNQLVAQINHRKKEQRTNERCIFYDLKGEFVSKQFNKKNDIIFSPFDQRSVSWSFFNEFETYPDYDVVCQSLYLCPDAKNEYWYNCAKDVFRTGLIYLKMNGKTSNREVWEFFSQTLEDIQLSFQTLPLAERGALKHIDKSDSNQSATIISILQERIQFFKYLVDMDGNFSFKKFIRDQVPTEGEKFKPHSNIYILNIEQYKTIFKPLMSLVLDTMIRETLSLPDQLDRRIFFIIDELGSLYRMDSIMDLLTIGRSKGACLICANQDLGRIEETYGQHNIKTIYNNFNTNFIFRINEPRSAEFLSQAIGERQVIKRVESRQMSPTDIGDRKNFSDQEKTERLVMPTEFQDFQDLHVLIKISNFGVSKIIVPKIFYKERHPNFVMKEFDQIHEELPSVEEDEIIYYEEIENNLEDEVTCISESEKEVSNEANEFTTNKDDLNKWD